MFPVGDGFLVCGGDVVWRMKAYTDVSGVFLVLNRIFRCLFVIRSFLTWGRIRKRKVSKGCQLETVGVSSSYRQLAITEIGRKSSFEKKQSFLCFPSIFMLRNL